MATNFSAYARHILFALSFIDAVVSENTWSTGQETARSQEVVRCPLRHVRFTTTRRRVEHKELMIHLLVHFHYTCLVSAPVAVVWRREYRHNGLLVTPIVTIHDQLMRPRDHLQVVRVIEVL